MRGHEIYTRIRQTSQKYVDSFRHQGGLAPVQPVRQTVASTAGCFFFDSGQASRIACLWKQRSPEEAARTVSRAERLLTRRYALLGYEGLDFGDPVDWQLDPVHGRRSPLAPFRSIPYLDFQTVGDHKIVWELSRHQHLVALVRAWLFSGDRRFADEALLQWRWWLTSNRYPLGVNWTSALEVAFRIQSWIWMDHMLAGSEYGAMALRKEFAAAIGHGAWYLRRYLSTYFAPNTHLLGEAYAMFAAGTLYPCFRDASRWAAEGWKIVNQEARNQVRGDGLHFEQSTYYHVYALDFFLHARILGSRNGLDTGELDLVIPRMAEGLGAISQGGIAPRFGDDDGGRVFDGDRNRTCHLLDPLSTAAALYANAQWKTQAGGLREETLWLLGESALSRFDALPAVAAEPRPALFADSGYVCLAQRTGVLVADAGQHGWGNGGHGHADALSVQLLSAGEALLTDPGTASYPVEKPERNRFRNTSAHGTLEVDGLGQAEPVESFRWRSIPSTTIERWHVGTAGSVLMARHDGYQRLADPVTHQRSIVSWNGSGWLVRDVAHARSRHTYRVRWPLPPGAEASQVQDGFIIRYTSGQILHVVGAAEAGWSWSIAPAEWSAVYGAISGCSQLVSAAAIEGAAEAATVLAIGERRPRLACLARNAGVTMYEWEDASGRRRLWFANGSGSWSHGGLSGDAALVIAAASQPLCIAGARILAVNGHTVLDSPREVDWRELSPGAAPLTELFAV
jgi:hypothetical protein